jgi:hypothetical protein
MNPNRLERKGANPAPSTKLLSPSDAALGTRVQPVMVRRDRDRASRLAAAPAVLVLAGSVLLLMVMHGRDVGERYQRDAEAAMLRRDYPTAQVCYERLLQRDPDSPMYRDGLSLATRGVAAQTTQATAPVR